MTAMIRFVLAACVLFVAAGCAGGDAGSAERHLWFVDGYLSELGMRGKLHRVERRTAGEDSPARALGELLKGPTTSERAQGLISALGSGVRVQTFSLTNGTATVRLAGELSQAGNVYAGAQVVYTLTEFAEVKRIRLYVGDERCCLWLMSGEPVRAPLERRHYRGWQGDPSPPPGSG
jgi:spore germination protein GerM